MSKVIQFQSGWIKDEDENIKLNFGDTFMFEFCPNMLIPVNYINLNSEIDQYIKEMSTDHLIFADFEFVPKFMLNQKEQHPPICVFTFCFSKGIYVFKQTNEIPNQDLKNFLKAESGHEFVGYSLQGIIGRLKEMFGQDFSINIEDVLKERLRPHQINIINKMFNKYGKDILFKISNMQTRHKNWDVKHLNFNFFAFTASLAFAISHFYPKFPKKTEINKNDQISYQKVTKSNINWKIGEERKVEFFPGQVTQVFLLNANRDLKKFIPILSKSSTISFDFRLYSLDFSAKKYISLFTFCAMEKVYSFYKTTKETDEKLKKFLSKENGLKFIGKETKKTITNLHKLYGDDFDIDLEDIDYTVLKKFNKNLRKSRKSGNIQKNDTFYQTVKSLLGDPCEKLDQYYCLTIGKNSSLSFNVMRTALWSLAVYEIYEKCNKSGKHSKKVEQTKVAENEDEDESENDDDDIDAAADCCNKNKNEKKDMKQTKVVKNEEELEYDEYDNVDDDYHKGKNEKKDMKQTKAVKNEEDAGNDEYDNDNDDDDNDDDNDNDDDDNDDDDNDDDDNDNDDDDNDDDNDDDDDDNDDDDDFDDNELIDNFED